MQWQEFRSSVRHLHAKDVLRIEQAFALGKKMHGDQKRKSGETYFSHPVAVATILAGMGADADTIIAALLHDTVEDTPLTLAEINEQFNGSVQTLIDGVTKLREEDVAHSPKLNEQMESLRKMFTLMDQDIRIMVIKLVDRLHNMQTIEFLSPERQKTMAQETSDVYAKIADRLCMQDLRDELDALCLAVLEPEMYERVRTMRVQNEQRGMKTIEDIRHQLRAYNPELASHVQLSFEFKTWTHLRSQVDMGDVLPKGSTTLTIAFVTDDADTCYRVLGALHRLWKREVLSFQDFINAPQLNGYEGVHTTLLFPDGSRIRCKIRTREMHEYARKGIATRCFDSKAQGIDTYLPWTKRISDLASDTEGSSDDFWQSLQSDILGESIVIHGPDDLTAQLPRKSTALDAVCYLFQKKALRTKKIMVNGINVSLKSPVPNAASVAVIFDKEPQVVRDWLEWTETGLAKSLIHGALAVQPTSLKLEQGKKLLGAIMHERKKGSIEEFDMDDVSTSLKKNGKPSLHKLLIDLAEGRRNASEVYDIIFHRKNTEKRGEEILKQYSLQCTMSKENSERLNEFFSITQRFLTEWHSVRIREMKDNMIRFSLVIRSSRDDIVQLEKDLQEVGATNIEYFVRSYREILLISTVITLWSLNPVLATYFLRQGIPPMTLVTIRFLTIGIFMSAFFGMWKMVSRKKFASIPRITLLALPSTIANACMMIYIYALQTVPPSIHLMILRFNTLLLPMQGGENRKESRDSLALFGFVFALTLAGLISMFGEHIILGLMLSSGTLIFYTLYSFSTERTLQQHNIDIRYPYFLLHSGLISGAIGVALLPWQSMDIILSPITIGIVTYVVFCICITQLCYAALLKTVRFKHFTHLFLIEVPLAVFFEYILLGISLPYSVYGIMLATIGGILLIRWKNIR